MAELIQMAGQVGRTPSDAVRAILLRQSQMEAARINFDSMWREIAERVLPRSNIFLRNYAGAIVQGEKRTEFIFDSTAQNALPRFASAMEYLLTPRTQRWHQLRPTNKAMIENRAIKLYLDTVNDILFEARYSPRANFASQKYEDYMSIGAYGNSCMFVDDHLGYSLRYRSCHIAEIFIEENAVGAIDTVHRKFAMTARQIAQRFGEDKIPQNVTAALETAKDREFDVLHCVYPRGDMKMAGRKDYRGMRYSSIYIEMAGKQVLEEGGYRTMPYMVGRYVTGPRETYGRSPASQALPDIKSSQAIRKTLLRAGELAVAPPLLLPEDGVLAPFSMRSESLNYGGISEKGEVMVKPLETGANLPQGFDIEERVHKDINDAFIQQLWQLIIDHPDMPVSNMLQISQQQGMLFGPMMGRQQSETLGPMIEREIDILARAGQLPPMPPELMDMGGAIRIEYTSPLNRMQRSGDGVAILNTINAAAPLFQFDPSLVGVFDGEATIRELADINGVPERVLTSPEQFAAMKQQQAQQQQMQSMLQAAPVAAGAAKDMATAASTAQDVPAIAQMMGGNGGGAPPQQPGQPAQAA